LRQRPLLEKQPFWQLWTKFRQFNVFIINKAKNHERL
jgi:hypothetical protein